ncbi:MAG: hypothetical protein ACFFCW_29630 [Candidatus Hodarchaeota archaeon]
MRKYALIVFILILTGCFNTREDNIYITKIDDEYLIKFVSTGKYIATITPEGPFPAWSDNSTFQTNGKGNNVNETDYEYIIGTNLESQYDKYKNGYIILSEISLEISLKADLSDKYRDTVNHSGKYSKVVIKSPPVFEISEFKSQEEMVGKYIRATGYFKNYQFFTGNYVFEDRHVSFVAGPGRNRHNSGLNYVVVGYVDHHYDKAKFEIIPFKASPLVGD